MSALATLNGKTVTSARLSIPAWGASYADITLDGAFTLSGPVTFILGDLTVQMAVISGGPANEAGRSYYRCVAGAGGWGKILPEFDYANDAGVKIATVLGDAASLVGETIDMTTVDPAAVVAGDAKFVSGMHFVRAAGPAGRLLEQLSPGAWYVGEDGVTRLGSRPTTTLSQSVAKTSELDLARGTLTFASTTIGNILPGVQIDGLTAVDVEHEFSVEGGFRTRIWGRQGGTSRRLTALRAIVDQLDPNRKFHGIFQYRIITQEQNGRLNLQPVRTSLGLPELRHVRVFPGVAGTSAEYVLGSIVLVGFIDADGSRPVVISFEDQESFGFVPTTLSVDASATAAIGPSATQVDIAGGAYFLVPAPAFAEVIFALNLLATELQGLTAPNILIPGTWSAIGVNLAAGISLGATGPVATSKTKAS